MKKSEKRRKHDWHWLCDPGKLSCHVLHRHDPVPRHWVCLAVREVLRWHLHQKQQQWRWNHGKLACQKLSSTWRFFDPSIKKTLLLSPKCERRKSSEDSQLRGGWGNSQWRWSSYGVHQASLGIWKTLLIVAIIYSIYINLVKCGRNYADTDTSLLMNTSQGIFLSLSISCLFLVLTLMQLFAEDFGILPGPKHDPRIQPLTLVGVDRLDGLRPKLSRMQTNSMN